MFEGESRRTARSKSVASWVLGAIPRCHLPDFIVKVDDRRLDLLVELAEVRGFRGEDAQCSAPDASPLIPTVTSRGKPQRRRAVVGSTPLLSGQGSAGGTCLGRSSLRSSRHS
jgi:hypothetical protein